MNIGNIRQTASENLAQARYNPRKLVLFHTGAALALTTVLTILNFILTRQIDGTGGLSGLGSRAILETARRMLQYASAILLPFWELGFVYAAIQLARGQEASPESLLEGFRRFMPALRLMLLRMVIYAVVGIVCMNISVTIFTMTPLANPMMEILEPVLNAGSAEEIQILMEQLPTEDMMEAILPAWIIFAVLFVLVMIPLLYRLRMAEFVLMDQPKTGAFAAVRSSFRMMRRNCWNLFRLDLGFWWFYLLLVPVTLLCYGDVLMGALGITLPIGENAQFFLFYIAYVLCQLALYTFAWGHVQTTYGVAYDTLLQKITPQSRPAPKAVPWENS